MHGGSFVPHVMPRFQWVMGAPTSTTERQRQRQHQHQHPHDYQHTTMGHSSAICWTAYSYLLLPHSRYTNTIPVQLS
jgi:hypothetical protein